jgi:hypothetical protein
MRNLKYKLLAFVLLSILILLSSLQQLKLDDMRNDLGLNDANDIQDKSPSVVFVTVALGSFRGFIANLLFLRSNRLQEERRYYEVHQLAKWIRNLQPKLTSAITYMGWNMAYNISVTFDTPEERWVWVSKGLELYRDAIRNHSSDPELYREYGWTFQHKMGMNLDDANRYYKQRWALLMIQILKAKPDVQKIAEVTRNPHILHEKLSRLDFHEFIKLLKVKKMSYADLVKRVLASPEHELPESFKRILKDEKWQTKIVEYIMQCERKRFKPETLAYLLEGFVDLEQVLDSIGGGWDFDKLEEEFRDLGRLPEVFKKAIVLQKRTKEEVLGVVDNFLRDRWLHIEYLLDSRKMWALSEEYGGLDWRIAETHAVYWARIGLKKDPTSVTCRRMVTQGLKDLVDRGKLLYFSSETYESIDWTYNLAIIDKVSEIIEANIAALPEQRRTTFKTGYGNFLKDCIVGLYVGGNKKKAKRYAQKFMDLTGSDEYKDFEKIMQRELLEDLTTMNDDSARLILNRYISQTLQQYCLYENEAFAMFYWDQTKKIYNYVKKEHQGRKNRTGWSRSFMDMTKSVVDDFIIKFPSRKSSALGLFNKLIPKSQSEKP